MKLILCGHSALSACSRLAALHVRMAQPVRIRSLNDCVVTKRDLKAFDPDAIRAFLNGVASSVQAAPFGDVYAEARPVASRSAHPRGRQAPFAVVQPNGSPVPSAAAQSSGCPASPDGVPGSERPASSAGVCANGDVASNVVAGGIDVPFPGLFPDEDANPNADTSVRAASTHQLVTSAAASANANANANASGQAATSLDDECLHILVAKESQRYRSKGVRRHVWSGRLPDKSVFRLKDDVFVTSPEFSLLLMSTLVPFNELVLLCCEVCGGYMRDRNHPKGFYKRPPLSSLKKIGDYLDKMGSARGALKLRRALRYAFDNAWSPMEGAVAMLISMPPRLGGYGFPKPLLNYQVDYEQEIQVMAGREDIKFDLLFKSSGVVIEYDSDEEHTGAERIRSDALRRNTALYLGYSVITLTWGQVRGIRSFHDVMKQLGRKLGKSVREPSDSTLSARFRLRKEALPPVRDR